ncbi:MULTISPECIES: FHA domain-containing protein [Aerosakkonema]|uniref:FHA domain-containing protein n=1 Tax=Aerosakkonema TaxID=1246629 RepID=UPI0035B84C61
MITLNLLHPLQSIPIQSWTFDEESVIRIGRATDNDVILYSAVVSRHHVELRRHGCNWEVLNLGANGTYLEGKRINEAAIRDGALIRLARSGPQIQVLLGTSNTKEGQKEGQKKIPAKQSPNEPKPDKSRDTLIHPRSEEREDATQLDA